MSETRTALRISVTAVVLMLVVGSAIASDPAVEAAIRAQDALLDRNDRVALLKQAKAALDGDESARNHYLLGRAYGLTNEFEKAREQFEWAIEKNPSFAYPYYGLGVYYHVKGNQEEAERNFLLSLKLDERLGRARAQLGKIYIGRQELGRAQKEFETILSYDPEDVQVRDLLATVYLQRKDYKKAIIEFRSVLKRSPNDPVATKCVALALSFAGNDDEALPAWRRTIQLLPHDLESYIFLKNLLAKKGDRKGAVSVLKQLLEQMGPDHKDAQEVKREIARLEGGGDMLPPPRTFQDLRNELGSEDVTRRREALRLFRELRFVPPPAEVVREVSVKRETDPVCRVMAVQILGVTGGRQVTGLFEVLLVSPKDRDPSEKVRGAVASSLAKTETAASIPVLLGALSDDSLYVFRLAVESLRKLTGVYFVEEPSVPIEADQRAEIAKKWAGWWQSGRAFAKKLDTIRDLEAIKNLRLLDYVIPLLADEDRLVAERARNAFKNLAGVALGTPDLLDSAAGRAKLRKLGAEAYAKLRGPR